MSVAKHKELAKYLLAVIITTITMMIWARDSTGCGFGAPRDFLSYSVFFNRGGLYYVHSSDVFWGIILVNSLLYSVKPQLGSFAETSNVLLLLCNLREPVTNLNLGSFCLDGSFALWKLVYVCARHKSRIWSFQHILLLKTYPLLCAVCGIRKHFWGW